MAGNSSDAPQRTHAGGGASADSAAAEGRIEVRIDDSDAVACYANFFRVVGTPDEVILDFGIDLQPYAQQSRTVKTSQRVAVHHATAKRLLAALSAAVQRHEKVFGTIEFDPSKRAKSQS